MVEPGRDRLQRFGFILFETEIFLDFFLDFTELTDILKILSLKKFQAKCPRLASRVFWRYDATVLERFGQRTRAYQ